MKEVNYQQWTSKDKTKQEIHDLYGKRKNALLSKNSKAETHFYNILHTQGEYYIREKAFIDDGFLCYVDFYFPKYRLAIEIDGPEHNTNRGRCRDSYKSNYLLNNRKVVTYRITNTECLLLTTINIYKIAVLAWQNYGIDIVSQINLKRQNNLSEWINQNQKKSSVDLSKPIYAYSKINKQFHIFKDCYDMCVCTTMKVKDLIRNLNNSDKFIIAVNFILGSTQEQLNQRVCEFLNTVS